MIKKNLLGKLCLCLFVTAAACIHGHAQSLFAYGYSFTASSQAYNYVTGGTNVSSIQVDDNYSSPIPIGFTFTFCGVDYTDVTVCSNGWLRFGSGVGSAVPNWNYNDQVNSGIQPAVYALYEDVSGDLGSANYIVTGSSPNRVFTMEWRDWLWDYAALNPSVSFQVKLYETSGKIECLYKQEAGAVALNSSGGATIGIANSGTDWQTIDGTGSSPVSSSTTYTYTLSTVPATGQSYLWDPGPSCTIPSALAVTNVNSKGVSFSWASVAGSTGYEYAVTTSSVPPVSGASTTNTFATVNGLLPANTYFLHVRNKCSSVSISKWASISFQTRPDCVIPTGVIASNIDSSSADISWGSVSSSTQYQYIVDTTITNPPTNLGGATNTSSNGMHLSGLTSGWTYYVHVRTLCAGSDSSEWILGQFYVPIPCRLPKIQVSDLSSDKAILYWSPVQTALNYEYSLDYSVLPPSLGTPTQFPYIMGAYLKSNTDYYFHARSLCEDKAVKTMSGWATINFKTLIATDIDNVGGEQNRMKVYPNPVKDILNIEITDPGGDAVVNLIDITGREVRAGKINKVNRVALDLNGLSSGVYQLKYIDNKHTESISISKQ